MVCPNSAGNCHNKLVLYAAGLVVGGVAIGYFIGQRVGKSRARCNHSVKLSTDKVVDTVDIEDIGEKKAFCRCWKSKKFPYCDGSHNAHNKESGDNVGPLVIKGKDN
ncbi:hypothetical protein FO519_004421 [Halicephalobus sp. NKZ332]|nr:hypothetical protein FO519_004421 [Halicephalobus sp. NKZ332]